LPTSNQIRNTFLKYFEHNDHRIVASSSLIPFDDPTLLFTNAGMNQFKDVFLGNEKRPYTRAVSSQKCMRVSGKHNDFREVGHSTRHHTFFEMLGNFSFGNYFKKEAIHFAWELVTREFGLDPKQLWITVYQDDGEAWDIWHRVVGIPTDRIMRLGEKDNFWAMGETGPCGPCSELHFDFGTSPRPDHPECDLTCPCGRWVDIWNLVFMQYNRNAAGEMKPLPSPSIDTGMGFERITTILQEKRTNYETDLFRPLLEAISGLADTEYGHDGHDDVSMRIIADHARAAAFAVADGQYPGNDKRGYVLRKIMRRAIVHGKKLKIDGPFLYRIVGTVVENMKKAFPELPGSGETIARVVKQEEDAFADTLAQGLMDLEERIRKLKSSDSAVLPAADAFFLYDTRGLPIEIIEDLAEEEGLTVDAAGFRRALEEQRKRSRRDYESGKVRQQIADSVYDGTTAFVGYDYRAPVQAVIQEILLDGQPAQSIAQGQKGELFLDTTPFYAEAGGQVGDIGSISNGENRAEITDTLYRGTATSHVLDVRSGSFRVGDRIEASIAADRRRMTMRNHTATHLLHGALKRILGDHVKQAGSLVAPDRLRFDFTHFSALSRNEIEKLEDAVNDQIWSNAEVRTNLMNREEALAAGAVALFGEKYQESVRVVEVPGFSKELCGGTHVPATGSIGLFKIISESGIAAGIRRIEAITGAGALHRFRSNENVLDLLQTEYKVQRKEIPALLEKLHRQIRDLERQNAVAKLKDARTHVESLLSSTREIRGVKILAQVLPQTDRASMRALADELKQKLGSGVVALGTDQNGKAALVVMVTGDLAKQLPAGKIIKGIAPIVGGSGGGKPELAEAGGKDSAKLADAIERSFEVVETLLTTQFS